MKPGLVIRQRNGSIEHRCYFDNNTIKATVSCAFCDQEATRLCDGSGQSGTCDTTLCAGHAERVGHNRDFCPDCLVGLQGKERAL